MPPELTPASPPSTWVDYLPVAWAILTLVLIPLLRRRSTILAFIRTVLEAASKSQKTETPATNGNGNGTALRFSAIAQESQATLLDTVVDTQRNNIKRMETLEHWRDNVLPKLESAAKIGAFNAFSGKMDQLQLDVNALQANDEIQRADILSLRELLTANSIAIAANAAKIKALEDRAA